MKKSLRVFTLVVAVTLVAGSATACSRKVQDLKSPCVGAEGSPCDKRPANAWMQHA